MSLLRSRWVALATVLLLIAVNIVIGYAVFHVPHPHGLRVSFLDIGQGDSILIQGPTGVNMLIDGGPDRSVLRELPAQLGPLDRRIDLMVETHPDADHITGLAEVFAQYDVGYFMTPGIPDETQTFKRVEAAADSEPGLMRLTARRGMRLHLGGGRLRRRALPG